MKTFIGWLIATIALLAIAATAQAHGLDTGTAISHADLALSGLGFGFAGMAKVSGPLMSMDARGKFANTLVFSGWKGRPTVRQLVQPTNPMSTDQVTARNMVRVGGAIQRFVNQSTLVNANLTLNDKLEIQAITPSGQAWNGYLVNFLIGSQALNYAAGRAVYAALQAGEKTAWVNAAAALVPAIPDVAQFAANNQAAAAMSKGEVFFMLEYALYKLGLQTVPGATPTVYA